MSSSSYQGRHYGGRHRVQYPSCPSAPSVQLELRAAHRGSRGARGDRDRSDASCTPRRAAADPRARPAPRPPWPAPSRSPTRPWSPTSPSAVTAASIQTAALPGPQRAGRPRGRRAAPTAQGRRARPRPSARRKRWVRPIHTWHITSGFGWRWGKTARRHRPRRRHRHPDLRDVQGRRHRLVLRLELRQQGRDQVLGRLDLLVRPPEQADRPEGRHRACRASSSGWSATPATPSARTCTSRCRRPPSTTARSTRSPWLQAARAQLTGPPAPSSR